MDKWVETIRNHDRFMALGVPHYIYNIIIYIIYIIYIYIYIYNYIIYIIYDIGSLPKCSNGLSLVNVNVYVTICC